MREEVMSSTVDLASVKGKVTADVFSAAEEIQKYVKEYALPALAEATAMAECGWRGVMGRRRSLPQSRRMGSLRTTQQSAQRGRHVRPSSRTFAGYSSRPTSEAPNLEVCMRTFMAVIERCPDTGLFVGYVPGFPGAHSQGETLDELHQNLAEVIGMLLEDGEPQLESEFIGTQKVQVA